MTAELYGSDCCGAVFAPGYGPDDIVEADPDDRADARRRVATRGDDPIRHDCPSCGAHDPALFRVREADLRL